MRTGWRLRAIKVFWKQSLHSKSMDLFNRLKLAYMCWIIYKKKTAMYSVTHPAREIGVSQPKLTRLSQALGFSVDLTA